MQQASLIDELEAAVAAKDLGRRAHVLRRVTDLFAAKSASYSGEQVSLALRAGAFD